METIDSLEGHSQVYGSGSVNEHSVLKLMTLAGILDDDHLCVPLPDSTSNIHTALAKV